MRLLALASSLLVIMALVTTHAEQPDRPMGGAGAKQAVAHRGASGYAPEHTIEAYRLALVQGADFVEQDLAVTKDGVLICLHDDTLERTSNIRSIFPNRFSKEGLIPGPDPHWIANDFTLDEIRQLDMGRWYSGRFRGARIATWQEAVDVVRGKAGLYPELKSPPLYTSRGVDMVKIFVDSVKRSGLDTPTSLATTPMIVQSFDEQTIRRLSAELPAVPRVLLLSSFPEGGLTSHRLTEIATFATGIGPAKGLVAGQPSVVQLAHAAGLRVTPYTFSAKTAGSMASLRAEMSRFLYDLGVDGLFTDNPDQFPRHANTK